MLMITIHYIRLFHLFHVPIDVIQTTHIHTTHILSCAYWCDTDNTYPHHTHSFMRLLMLYRQQHIHTTHILSCAYWCDTDNNTYPHHTHSFMCLLMWYRQQHISTPHTFFHVPIDVIQTTTHIHTTHILSCAYWCDTDNTYPHHTHSFMCLLMWYRQRISTPHTFFHAPIYVIQTTTHPHHTHSFMCLLMWYRQQHISTPHTFFHVPIDVIQTTHIHTTHILSCAYWCDTDNTYPHHTHS